MLEITTILKTVLADKNEAGMHSCIGRFLGVAGDDEVLDAYDEVVGSACDASAYRDEINRAFATGVVAATLDTVCDEDWLEQLDGGVRTTEITSVVGIGCLQLIVRADMLMADMADVDDEVRETLQKGVAHQCAVFLYG